MLRIGSDRSITDKNFRIMDVR